MNKEEGKLYPKSYVLYLASRRKYYKKNKERINEKSKKYYETHKEECAENRRNYRKTHKKQIAKYQKEGICPIMRKVRREELKLEKRKKEKEKHLNNHIHSIKEKIQTQPPKRRTFNQIKAFLKKAITRERDIIIEGIRYKNKNNYWISTEEKIPSLSNEEMIIYISTFTRTTRAVMLI